ncbi:MAG: hypothetical protein FWE31_05180 [Firmicutes bacterium]|nr:hypothetical protein [Bacillota bacterium]
MKLNLSVSTQRKILIGVIALSICLAILMTILGSLEHRNLDAGQAMSFGRAFLWISLASVFLIGGVGVPLVFYFRIQEQPQEIEVVEVEEQAS